MSGYLVLLVWSCWQYWLLWWQPGCFIRSVCLAAHQRDCLLSRALRLSLSCFLSPGINDREILALVVVLFLSSLCTFGCTTRITRVILKTVIGTFRLIDLQSEVAESHESHRWFYLKNQYFTKKKLNLKRIPGVSCNLTNQLTHPIKDRGDAHFRKHRV